MFVAASTNPVLVRANFDDARIWGLEWLGEFKLHATTRRSASTYTYMRAKDLDTGLPPNIEGGTPAPGGTVWVRYAKTGQKWWVEPYVNFAAASRRTCRRSTQGDRRTGATRTRAQIQNYFRRGATVNGWVSAGTDGMFGNADDILIATGETLAQVQDRVLGVGVNSAPMFTAVPSYVAVRRPLRHRPSARTTRSSWTPKTSRNESYRGISWGMDGAGRGVSFRYIALVDR